MTRYICKCGRVVQKSTNADNTGNRETDGCEGCPYRIPWGPTQWDSTRHAMVAEIKGYECRMSPALDYATYYQGNGVDKCVLHIYSLDYDFLDRLSAWVAEQFPEGEISCNFDRSKVRASEFIGGLYNISIYPMQNKRGISAKAALIERFFGPDKHRLDMTPEEEKAHILAVIEDGKARAQKKEEKSLTYRDPSTGWLYRVSPEPFQGSYFVQYLDPKSSVIWKRCTGAVLCAGSLKKEVEEEYLRLNAKRSGWELVADEPDTNPTSSAVVTAAAEETVDDSEASGLDSMTAACAANSNELREVATENALAGVDGSTAFDYSGLDDQTVAELHLAEREYTGGKKMAEMGLRRMADAVAIAHDALCVTDATICRNGGKFAAPEQSFSAWCESIGIHRKSAERLLQVAKLMDSSTPREEKVLEELSPSLLYAAAKPSAPAELVQAVKDGDITTHKQYQELLEKYKAEQQAHQAERESTSELLRDEQQRRQKADEARIAADRRAESAQAEVDEARRREVEARAAAHKYHVQVEEVEAQRNALLDQQTEYIDRIHELEARPVEVAVQEPTEEQIAAAAKQRTAMLEAQVRSLQADKDSALRQLDELGNTAYMTAAEFADNAARTVDSIRTAFWALAKELSGDDFAEALAPLDEAVRKIYEREWDDEESEA